MNDELMSWVSQWQGLETAKIGLLRKHKSLHRLESLSFCVWSAVGIVIAMGAIPLGWLVERHGWTPTYVFMAAMLLLSTTVLAVSLVVWRRQASRDDERLTDSPLGLLNDILAMRRRELFGWTDWRSIGAGVLQGAGGVAFLVYELVVRGSLVYVILLALLFVYLVGVLIGGVMRTRFLRRELARLDAIAAELAEVG